MIPRYIVSIILLWIGLTACATPAPPITASQVIQPATATISPTSSPMIATSTSTSSPATPTSTPTPSPTPSPSPTAVPHPLSIDYLRAREYPVSEIQIEETLDNGDNYYRYLASYQSDGYKIYALLTVPYGEKPATGWPVVVFNHGYIPPAQYRTTERYVAYVDGFARSGYIVLRSDYRGHGNSEGPARGAYGSPDYTIDVLNAVSAIKNFPEADPERIGMWGHSMGGYITLRSMVATEDIKAGVIWAGVVASYEDLLARWTRRGSSAPTPDNGTPSPRRWRGSLIEMYGDPQTNPDFWNSISANSYLEDLSGPVQLHHGTSDASVPLEFSQILNQQIQAVGGTVEYHEYSQDNHNLSNFFTQAMLRSIAFFDRYVKGES